MTEDLGAGYLSGLPEDQRDELTRVSAPGSTALREYLASGQAVAFLGAGVSAPLYPLWEGLISELVDAAASRLTAKEAATCRALAHDSPEAVVEIVRRGLGPGVFREVLRRVLRVRTDPESGRCWTPVQELVCRCPFKAVVTTNYDPGIVDARMRVRPTASATGFMTWEDELGLDRWRSGDVFGDAELPVLFAHGQHNRPDSIVLATTEYRRAYAGKLPHVLGQLMVGGHLVWIGFSFADQRVTAILREIDNHTGTRIDPGGAPRHVALMAWDPAGTGNDPEILAQRAEIEYGAQVVLYPAPGGDHSALALLLEALAEARFPAAGALPARATPTAGPGGRDVLDQDAGPGGRGAPGAGAVPGGRDALRMGDLPDVGALPGGSGPAGAEIPSGHSAPAVSDARGGGNVPAVWVPAMEPVAYFTGRAEELARLDRWAADRQVSLVGVTAWGGAGKTALVTHWIQQAGGAAGRPGIRGVFGWSFYADPSADHWAEALLAWARDDLGVAIMGSDRVAAAVLAVLRAVPVVLVLDGLEVAQEGPAGGEFGRLLDGSLREVLAGACQGGHGGLVVLTSRFPFADLEAFDGSSARMLDVPPFTPAEGAVLMAAAGGQWLPEVERRGLVAAVDGHALAVGVLGGLLADRPPATDLAALTAGLEAAARTDARVGRVLAFYGDRLAEADRYLLAGVCLFARPVDAAGVLAVAGHEVFAGRLAGWTPAMVQVAVRDRLAGLASWHPDGTISAHPLVRDTFRPLALGAADTAAGTSLDGLPAGTVASRADALLVVEAIELLLDAGHWTPADDLYQSRCSGPPPVWLALPAARLGQRAATAFAAPARRAACAAHLTPHDLSYYLNEVGLYAMLAGDLATARDYLPQVATHYRDARNTPNLAVCLRNLTDCLGYLGQPGPARDAAAESLACAQATGNRSSIRDAHASLGWVAGLSGDTTQAEEQFTAADQISLSDDPDGDHLYSIRGVWWAEWLAATGRPAPAQALTARNAEISHQYGWNDTLARCERVRGVLALAAGDTATATGHLAAAATAFRDGDYLTELAATLPTLADCARATGDLDAAGRHATEAITLAAARGLVPAQCAALAARARLHATHATATPAPDPVYQGRDAADAALRLATRHHLPWAELDVLRAHAALDHAEGTGQGWASKADALHARLVPPGLDPDPLATVEKLVAAQKAAEDTDQDKGDD
jgi:tetratricopeptide (TPR) repeat protein